MPIWEFSDFADVVDKARKIVPKYNRDVSISVDKEYLYINGMGMPTGPCGGTGMVLMGTENRAYWDVLPAVGATGLQGPQGVTGPFYGPPGETGVQGATGLQGQGVTGSQGQTGLYTIRQASNNPTGLPNMETYWDTEEEALFCKVEDQWIQVSSASQKGVTGVQGIQGSTGLRGPTGVQGITGLRGLTGIQGATGVQGQTGLRGASGIVGATGLQGPTGAYGGPQGVTGLQGTTGAAGIERQGFCAASVSTQSNATGDTTSATVIFGYEIYDIGSNYNTSTGAFTCPLTSKWHFDANVFLTGILTTHTSANITINTSNRFYTKAYLLNEYSPSSLHATISCDVDVDVNDTVSVLVQVSGSGGKVVDIDANGADSTHVWTTFSGHIIG